MGCRRARYDPNLRIIGVACHIGSQLTELSPLCDALGRVLDFVDQLEADGIALEHIDFGGGLGVRYRDETPPSPAQYGAAIVEQMRARAPELPVIIEPGRAIVGNAGVLLTRVNCIKHGDASNFCVVDAGMNDLLRPALYQSHQEIVEVEQAAPADAGEYDVVGPVCESSDFLGKARRLRVRESDLLAVRTAGAYGAVMSSNYNARPRPAEVMVDGDQFHIVRQREAIEDLYRGESTLNDETT
ncbi:MAG: diaminopimelate decarboxylase family protein [bacterium]